MPDFSELKEFIERAQKFMLSQGHDNDFRVYLRNKRINDKWYKCGRTREWQRIYEKSPKGKLQAKRRKAYGGYYRINKAVSRHDIESIRDFYSNTPKGYQVDHVIPLGDGGEHVLENLQYLSRYENQRKPKRTNTTMKVQLMRNRFIRKL